MPTFPVKLLKLSPLLKCHKWAGALHMGQGRSPCDAQGAQDIFLSGGEEGVWTAFLISCPTLGKLPIHPAPQNSCQVPSSAQTQLWSQGKAHNSHILGHTSTFSCPLKSSDCDHHHVLWRKELNSLKWNSTQKQLRTRRDGGFTACLAKSLL